MDLSVSKCKGCDVVLYNVCGGCYEKYKMGHGPLITPKQETPPSSSYTLQDMLSGFNNSIIAGDIVRKALWQERIAEYLGGKVIKR